MILNVLVSDRQRGIPSRLAVRLSQMLDQRLSTLPLPLWRRLEGDTNLWKASLRSLAGDLVPHY